MDSMTSIENEVLYYLDSETFGLSEKVTQAGVDAFSLIGREAISASPALVALVTPEAAALMETQWVLPVADLGVIRWRHDLLEVTSNGVELSASTVASLVAIGMWVERIDIHG